MDKYTLPTSCIIDDLECEFNADYRCIIKIFSILAEPDLLEYERVLIALDLFYKDNNYTKNLEQATKEMYSFISACEEPSSSNKKDKKPLYDWEQDFNIIISPVNKIIGSDVRGLKFLHWWTFLSAFMEVGECTFATYVAIRNKKNKGKKLDKFEERLFMENKDKILLKKKVDSTTQSIMDMIMGKEV